MSNYEPVTLGDLIGLFEKIDPETEFVWGIENPHSSWGCFHHLAFDARADHENPQKASKILKTLRKCVGKSFENHHKGGDYKMDRHTSCVLVVNNNSSPLPLTKNYFLDQLKG